MITTKPKGRIAHTEAFTEETLRKTFEKQCINKELYSKPFFDFVIYSSTNVSDIVDSLEMRGDDIASTHLNKMKNDFEQTLIPEMISSYKEASKNSIFTDIRLTEDKKNYSLHFEDEPSQLLTNIKNTGKINEMVMEDFYHDSANFQQRPTFKYVGEEAQESSDNTSRLHSNEWLYRNLTPEQLFNSNKKTENQKNDNLNKPLEINHFFDDPFGVPNEDFWLNNLNSTLDFIKQRPTIKDIEIWMSKNRHDCLRIFNMQKPSNKIEVKILTILTQRIKVRIANAIHDEIIKTNKVVNGETKQLFINDNTNFRINKSKQDIFQQDEQSLNTNNLSEEQINEYFTIFQQKNLQEAKTEITKEKGNFDEKLITNLKTASDIEGDVNGLVSLLEETKLLSPVLNFLKADISQFKSLSSKDQKHVFFADSNASERTEWLFKNIMKIADKSFFETTLKKTDSNDTIFLNTPFPLNVQLQLKALFSQCDKFREQEKEFLEKNAHTQTVGTDSVFAKPIVQLYFKIEKEWKDLLTSGDSKKILMKYEQLSKETEKFLDGSDYNKKAFKNKVQNKNSFLSKITMPFKSKEERPNWSAFKENIFNTEPLESQRNWDDLIKGQFLSYTSPAGYLEIFANQRAIRALTEHYKTVNKIITEKHRYHNGFSLDEYENALNARNKNIMQTYAVNSHFQNYQKNIWLISKARYDLTKEPKGTHLIHTEDWYDDFIDMISDRSNVDLFKVGVSKTDNGFTLDKLDSESAKKVLNWFKERGLVVPIIEEQITSSTMSDVSKNEKTFSIGPIEAFDIHKTPTNGLGQTTVPYPFSKPFFTDQELQDIVEIMKTKSQNISRVFDNNLTMKEFTLNKYKSIENLKEMFNFDEKTNKYFPIPHPDFDWLQVSKIVAVSKRKKNLPNNSYPIHPTEAMIDTKTNMLNEDVRETFLADLEAVETEMNNYNSKSKEQKDFTEAKARGESITRAISKDGEQSLLSYDAIKTMQTSAHMIHQDPASRIMQALTVKDIHKPLVKIPPEKDILLPANFEEFLKVKSPGPNQTIRGNTLDNKEYLEKFMDKFQDLIAYKIFQFCYPKTAGGISYESALLSEELQTRFKLFKTSQNTLEGSYILGETGAFVKNKNEIASEDSIKSKTTGNSGWLKSLLSETFMKNLLNLYDLKEEINHIEKNTPSSNEKANAQTKKIIQGIEESIRSGSKILNTSKSFFDNLKIESAKSNLYLKLKNKLTNKNPNFKNEPDLEFIRILREYIIQILPNEIPKIREQARSLVDAKHGNSDVGIFGAEYAEKLKELFPEVEIIQSTKIQVNPENGKKKLIPINDVFVETESMTTLPSVTRELAKIKKSGQTDNNLQEIYINENLQFNYAAKELNTKPLLVNATAEKRSSTQPFHDVENTVTIDGVTYEKTTGTGLYAKRGFTSHAADTKNELAKLANPNNKESIFLNNTVKTFKNEQITNSLDYKLTEDYYEIDSEVGREMLTQQFLPENTNQKVPLKKVRVL